MPSLRAVLARPLALAILIAGVVAPLPSAPLRAEDGPDLRTIDRTIYEASGAVAPRHPVTGRPVLNVVPEALEVRLARDFFRDYAQRAAARGVAIDPPGARMERVRHSFRRPVGVAHRRHLPWEVHLVDEPIPNAFTAGGGLVVVLAGLWDDMLREHEAEGLATVLAHEIAHVTLLHPPIRTTWLGAGEAMSREGVDPYYRAAYSHEQEAEADRLSVLYLALAGVDPHAAARLWRRVAARSADSAAAAGYLHDHPVSAERIRITADAARATERYFRDGRRNPRSAAILEHNVLYPRTRDDGYQTGDGIVRAAIAALDVFQVHRRAARSRDVRRASADDQARVRVVGTWHQQTNEGEPGLGVELWNGGSRPVASVRVALSYWHAGAMVLIEDCQQPIRIDPGSARSLVCPRQGVASDRIEPQVREVAWR